MYLIASHQGRPSDDPIFSLHQEATRRREAGEAIVDATIGVLLGDDGKLAVLPAVARAVREVSAADWATYAPIAGTAEFRRAVIDDLLGEAPDLRRIAVAVATPGGSGALRHAISNFLHPGQAALTTNWYWSPYRTLCDEADRKLETYEMFARSAADTGAGGTGGTEGTRSGLDVGALDAALARQIGTQGRALVLMNDPAHNPTGYTMSGDEWRAVVACVAARAATAPVTLLVDCAYLHYGPSDPRGFAGRLTSLAGKALVLFAWSASKSFTHYGLRVGALLACVGGDKERGDVESALSYSCRGTWSNCNRGGMTAITRVLTDERLAAECRGERNELKAVLEGRVRTFNRLAERAGLRYPRYGGGFFVTVFVENAHERAQMMRSRGIYVVPQARSGDGSLSGVLRVALCAVAERDIGRLVDALAE